MKTIALVACRPPGFDRVCFIASTERDRELLKKANIGLGEVIEMPLRLDRHGKHHRLVFALLRFVFKNQEGWDTEESLREALTLRTSFTYNIRTLGGRYEKRARSWSYQEMDEADFSQLHDELVKVILTEFFPTQSEYWLRNSIDQDAMIEGLMGFS